MTTIGNIWTALHQGKEVLNPANWKNTQLMASIITALLGVVFFILQFAGLHLPDISADTTVEFAGCIATFLGLVNGVMTAASSKKVGLKKVDE